MEISESFASSGIGGILLLFAQKNRPDFDSIMVKRNVGFYLCGTSLR